MAAVIASACFEGTPSPSSLLTYTRKIEQTNKVNKLKQTICNIATHSELQIKVKSKQGKQMGGKNVNYYKG